jgi:hypothetical protein
MHGDASDLAFRGGEGAQLTRAAAKLGMTQSLSQIIETLRNGSASDS